MCSRSGTLRRMIRFMRRDAVLFAVIIACLADPAHAELISFGSGGNQFTMEFVEIGDPGNVADTSGTPIPAGSVGYTYSIGKHEVSRDMVTKANHAGGLGISLHSMNLVGGPRADMPATGTTWNETARFVNWLNTSSGFSPAYSFALQPGDVGYNSNANILLWQPGDPGYDAANPFRNSLAKYALPTTDEWYKAAFYDPSANAGTGGYHNYATGNDTAPTAVASGTAIGTAIYSQPFSQGPADITQAGGLSPLGTMGQSGNVYEWEETTHVLSNSSGSSGRGLRGGLWSSSTGVLSSLSRSGDSPENESFFIGFRVTSLSTATVPEPSSIVLTTCAFLCGLKRRERCKK